MEIRVCDVCREPDRPIRTYKIVASDGREGVTDRCEAHDQPFESVIAGATVTEADVQPPRRSTSRRLSAVAARFTTLEEIEAKKRQRQ